MPTARLSELLAGITTIDVAADRTISGLQLDSRGLSRGELFLALPGTQVDGRDFVLDACERGAAAILYEARAGLKLKLAIPAIAIPDLRRHLGVIASRFYGAPSRDLVVIGVTGTNGKTTCTQLLAQALDRPPRRCAVIGTLGYGFPGELTAGAHTTPDALTLHRLFADYRARGATYMAMEVSSHALAQERVGGVAFDGAVFTNLSRDHLDYHGDMSAYGAAKARLFDYETLRYAVINQDDPFGRELQRRIGTRYQTLSFGLSGGDVRALEVRPTRAGLALRIMTPAGATELSVPLFGRFNALNVLAVLGALLLTGLKLEDATGRLRGVTPVPGRVERFGGAAATPLIVVDYAHTPDALEKVLNAVREHTCGKVWCVFGCGGDRDRGKRPEMGAIAERLADVVVLTDDNPRRESGDAIIADIRAGMHSTPKVMRARKQAISWAIGSAAANDIVLIAGKGHETYQQIGDERHPFSDREVVKSLLGVAA